MYFVTPSNPNIFLMFGAHDLHFMGMGEKDGKLCIYQKSIFDIGNWKEFYVTDIDAVKTECCENGLHAANGLCADKTIWISTREKEFTRIFSIDIDTKKFTRYKMLDEINQEFALLNLNLCCKCLYPIIYNVNHHDSNILSFNIIPEKYQSNVGVFRYFFSVNQSEQSCLLWKKNDPLILDQRILSSNILINDNGEVLSVIKKSEENGRIETLLIESENAKCVTNLPYNDDDINLIWHEVAFSSMNDLCLTRRKEGDKNFLRLFYVEFSPTPVPNTFNLVDHYIVDAKFPTLESIHFFVKFRKVDKEYIPKKSNKIIIGKGREELHLIPSFIFFQCPDGSTVSIPLEVLSLSQSAYLTLTRIPKPSPPKQQRRRSLTIANVTIYDYIFQAIRNIFGRNESKKEIVSRKKIIKDPWMSLNFIKALIDWPNILPLINAPNLQCSSDK